MLNKKYSDYIEISPTFESVVDIGADERNKNLWREYIVGDDMEKLVNSLCQSLNNEGFDNEGNDLRRSFWIHGSYGTGKSYAAILVKHLMEESPEVIEDYLGKNNRLSAYKNRFMKCRKKGGDFLIIWKTGCTGLRDGNALLMEAETAIREALKNKFGDSADFADESLVDAVRAQLHSPVHNWQYILDNSILGDDYASVEELTEKVDSGDLKALQKTAAVIRNYNWGLVDSLETFEKWVSAIIVNNHLEKSGIFFIWDEFTEYLLNSEDVTILQQLSEFTKNQPLYWMFIVHRSQEMIEDLTPDRYQLITHRFHQIEFHITQDAALDLIAGSINIRNGMREHWLEARKPVINEIRPFLPDMSGLDDKISEKIDSLCPIHPMTIKLLSRVAENYAAAQRTMFRFMKDQSNSTLGFVGYINQEGPDDQACWLTPDWLWDYFFTRESDFSDKETKVPEYIRHFEESRNLVEKDENSFRVFKIAMLLLAVMSSTKGLYGGKRTKDGISATEECLEICLAGVMQKETVHDVLLTLQDCKLIVLDKDQHDNVRLQLPFSGSSSDEFSARFAILDKKYSRYQMFSKDGDFALAFEKMASDENDVVNKRMKIAVCCAETNSIKIRLDEVVKDLERAPYKLGLLIVTVSSDSQASSIEDVLKKLAVESKEPRLTIALLREPLSDDKRKKWLTARTKQDLASSYGRTGSVNQYKTEAQSIITSWVNSAVSAGKIIAYNEKSVFTNQYGIANLRKTIRTNVLDKIFTFAPENIVVTNTAYKSCNDSALTAGISRKSNNTQLKNVLNSLESEEILSIVKIEDMEGAHGSKAKDSIAALAKVIHQEMESGQKVFLGELWDKLQRAPFGYYDSIACGVLLGYVFSCYINSKYTWTDSAQSPLVLTESTVSKMILNMCKGRMSTDYLSAGSLTWQKFSEYIRSIFDLSVAQTAEQTSGFHNVREAVTNSGAPFWALKYLPEGTWPSEDLHKISLEVIDNIQIFISQDGEVETAMSNVLQLMKGKGKIREVLAKSFKDKTVMATAMREFLFSASPELKEIATKLNIQPEELNDKLHTVMQGTIYTWTEEQVIGKLSDIADEYKYIEVIANVYGEPIHSLEKAEKEFSNLFNHLRISMAAIEQLNPEWLPALQALYKIASGDATQLDSKQRQDDALQLSKYGNYAKDCLSDGKPVLSDILSKKGIECTNDELDSIYLGLRDLSYDTSLTQFEKELNNQVGKISFARNKVMLKETWKSISGMDSVKAWCSEYEAPIMWISSKEIQVAINTLMDVEKNNYVVDAAVVSAINTLRDTDTSIFTDKEKVQEAFLKVVGTEYVDIWTSEHSSLIGQAKLKFGNDMSAWSIGDLSLLQKMLKNAMQEKAKKEKLADTQESVNNMDVDSLRKRVVSFLDSHPEFCDNFSE